MGSFIARLGSRKVNWQDLGVRFVDVFTRPSLNERLDTLEAHHAETHKRIVATVEKFEVLVSANKEILDANVAALNELRQFHESRKDRIDTMTDQLARLVDHAGQANLKD